jgi:hypothetical protein
MIQSFGSSRGHEGSTLKVGGCFDAAAFCPLAGEVNTTSMAAQSSKTVNTIPVLMADSLTFLANSERWLIICR